MNILCKEIDIDSESALLSSIVLAVIGASTILILPGLVGVIADTLGLTAQQLGYVASADIIGMAVSMAVVAFIIHRVSWRPLALLGLILIIVGNTMNQNFTKYFLSF